MTVDEQRARLLGNLQDTLSGYAAVSAAGCCEVVQGCLCVYSGRPAAVFNTVLPLAGVAGVHDLRRQAAAVDAWYRQKKARWSLWLLEYQLTAECLRALPPLLAEYGLRLVSRGEGMAADGLSERQRALPELQVQRVGRPATRIEFCQVMGLAFLTPVQTFLDVYHNADYWAGSMHGYLGYWQGRAVSTACVLASQGVLGVYGVAVLPELQRRGFGEAMMREVLEREMAETGQQRIVLEASEAAVHLYRRLGFAKLTRVSIYSAAR
jgi:ribosomal protein S18 acetylase RimI-like enzyme